MIPDKKQKISPKIFMNRVLERNGKMGEAACEIMANAIYAVNPYLCIKDVVKMSGSLLRIGLQSVDINQFERIFLIGFGKASVAMARSLMDIIGENLTSVGVITKDKQFLDESGYQGKLEIYIGGHPVPSLASIESTQALLNSLPELTDKDLVLVVISGGGSALFTNPIGKVTLKDLQEMTQMLLNSGANISEINTLRKHLDQVKGGRLAVRLQPAQVHTFILSDVIGDRLDMIASGPTVPDPTTYRDALAVIKKYHLTNKVPSPILRCLNDGINGKISETLKLEEFPSERIKNHLVGTNIKAARAAQSRAKKLGYNSLIISSHLTGHTEDVAEFLDGIIQTVNAYDQPVSKPACLIFGGETTVEVKGDGLGGRNQDLVLKMVKRLSEKLGVLVISLATDGEDGPTDAAGAASDRLVYHEGASILGLSVDTYIETNNSYEYFRNTGGLIKTGSTGTNVNDLVIILFDAPAGV